ncbi:MAG: NYN domain-containing protein [Chloroflexi bacterium]|nr:NYN domain-containing protein [Chloroflexota bacterium]
MPDVALLIDWENVYYTMRQHTEGPLPSTLSILQAILTKAASFGPVRVKLAIFGQEVSSQDETLLMALEFTGIEPIAVAQRMSGRLLKGRSDAVLITRAMKLLYKDRPDIDTWFIVSGDRDLNALCKALKDEDKHVYLVAGDQSLANELRESPYLRDDVFLLEDLIPEARWTRSGTGLRADDTQQDRAERELPAAVRTVPGGDRARRTRGGRGRRPVEAARSAPTVPAVVPTGEPESEKEQRRLAVLLLDQLVALRAREVKRSDFVSGVVPLSEKEASTVLEQRIDAAVEQGHVAARSVGRSRAKANMLIRPEVTSPLVAETFFHLVRVLRRIESVTTDARRVPAVEAVLDPLSRAEQPGGVARGRSARRILLETLFSIAEERGAIMTEQVQRDGKQITMCWLADGHPLVEYAKRPAVSVVHLFNFVHATRAKDDTTGWVNAALFAELLARVEGERIERVLQGAVQRGLMRAQEHGKRAGYVMDPAHLEARAVLGEFDLLEQTPVAEAAMPLAPLAVPLPLPDASGIVPAASDGGPPKRKTRRGSRGGRGRRGGARRAAAG